MDEQLNLTPIQNVLPKAKSVLVLLAANPNLDQVAAALALYLSIKKQQKQVLIACSSAMTVGFNRLFGINKVSDKIGNRNLIISFDYLKDSIEKVSYNIENNKFNLVVEPRPGLPSLQADKVSYSYSGSEADLIFVVGALKLEDLDKLYFNEKKIFENSLTVNLDNRANNTNFGKVNLVDSQAASCCEIATLLIKGLNLPVDQDIATNLLTGIETNTANFQAPSTSATTFEAAAWCLKNGAKKGYLVDQKTISRIQAAPKQATVIQPSFAAPKPSGREPQPVKQPPPDWFKPKIFKGNTVI